MNNILQLFIKNGGFVTFVILEAICFFIVINFNERQNGIFANTSMQFSRAIGARRATLDRYISAADSLESLNNRLFFLQTALENARQVRVLQKDTFYLVHQDSLKSKIMVPQFRYIAAEITNNSIAGQNNWITINRGKKQGLRPNMGVVTNNGLVGVVRYVSDNYSIVMSLLNRQTKISASLKRQGFFGSLVWQGSSPIEMTLTDIPKHVEIVSGDTVVTSGYSAMFPPHFMIGTVVKDSIPSGSNFYSITVKLSNDLCKTNYVRVVDNLFQTEIDSLQIRIRN